MSYESGNFTGKEWLDTVTLSPDLVILGQSIGVASSSFSFNRIGSGIDGVLGVGPTGFTRGTVNNTGTVPTVSDNLFSQGTISEEVLGLYFIPAAETSKSGEITFGGYDESAILGPMNYVPLTTTSLSSSYWSFEQSISYGGTTILSEATGVVGSDTTLVLIATGECCDTG